jgi:hypothetical protein
MEYRLLGASGLEVSVLSFGTMTLGGEGRFAAMGNVQAEEARRQVEICIVGPVNFSHSEGNRNGGLGSVRPLRACGSSTGMGQWRQVDV